MTEPEIIEISAPPSRRRARGRLQPALAVLIGVVVLDGALRLAWFLPVVPDLVSNGPEFVALSMAGFVAVLFPLALLARHPDAWHTDRLLLGGTLLLAAGELASALAAFANWWLVAQTPADVISGWQVVVRIANLLGQSSGVLGCVGMGALGVGLGRHAWIPPSRMPRLLSMLIVGPPPAGVAVVVASLVRSSTYLDVVGVVTIAVVMAQPLALALLVWASVSGVRLGRAPRQAWWLAVAGSGGWFAAVLLLDVLLLMQGLLGLAWSGTLPLMVHAMLTAIGMLLVVIALAAGLPARPAEEDGVGE